MVVNEMEDILNLLGITSVTRSIFLPVSTAVEVTSVSDFRELVAWLSKFTGGEPIAVDGIAYFPSVSVAVFLHGVSREQWLALLKAVMDEGYELPVFPKALEYLVKNDGIEIRGTLDTSFVAKLLRNEISRIREKVEASLKEALAVSVGAEKHAVLSHVVFHSLSADLAVPVRFVWVRSRLLELRETIWLRGSINVMRGNYPELFGDFKCIPAWLGRDFCFGDLPPFDGSLRWLRDFIWWVAFPNFDNSGAGACCFVDRFRSVLPDAFFRWWG